VSGMSAVQARPDGIVTAESRRTHADLPTASRQSRPLVLKEAAGF
jgi:hypothetical protein